VSNNLKQPMRLGLGTVQFGLNYGVANTVGQVSQSVMGEILNCAKEEGMSTLDTAISYGSSEERLGKCGVEDWNIVTKLPPLPNDCTDITNWVNNEISASLERLHVNRVYALLLHKPTQLLGSYGELLWYAMKQLKRNGLVKKIGFSIYESVELDLLWSDFQPDIIQAPYNILDQRLKISGWLEKLKKHDVEVHVRSVFLQGLLLLNHQTRPEKFNRWNDMWKVWDQWLFDEQLDPVDACLGFVNAEHLIDRIVVGVDSLSQLQELICSTNAQVKDVPQELCQVDNDLINPANWNKL